MGSHGHTHDLVPAGGIHPETGEWIPSHPKFLVPASALRELFRAKFREALKAADPDVFAQVPATTWRKNWVVHCKPVGNGEAALKYLTPYLYRVALSNSRLVNMENGKVTVRYKPRNASWRTMMLDVMTFLHRFLQHVLPQGFQKVRYRGFLHPSARKSLAALQEQLATDDARSDQLPESLASTFGIEVTDGSTDDEPLPDPSLCCPHCGGPWAYIGRMPPRAQTRPPP